MSAERSGAVEWDDGTVNHAATRGWNSGSVDVIARELDRCPLTVDEVVWIMEREP